LFLAKITGIMRKKTKIILVIIATLITLGVIFFLLTGNPANKLLKTYGDRQAVIITDRKGKILSLEKNKLGNYAQYINKVPENFKKLLLKKEDKYFSYHPGINPVSTLRAVYNRLTKTGSGASSTITQQLVKILLGNESNRTWKNKLIETYYSLALETRVSKQEILIMYANSVFFGNNTQGIASASQLYFNTEPENLDQAQIIRLLATVSNPNDSNPFKDRNIDATKILASDMKEDVSDKQLTKFSIIDIEKLKTDFYNYCQDEAMLEIKSLKYSCDKYCTLTIDKELTKKLRAFLKGNLQMLAQKNVANGAIVVIKEPENEILALVGTPDSSIDAYGYKINMTTEARPIGSTVKPFIYLKAFEKNLRPYSFVDDVEYKYNIGTGFALYPKNYDLKYNGRVTLHYALSNSLNVPAVKVLEYVGVDNFNNFLTKNLEFKPIQDLKQYQLGIALGGLEMDLLNLSYYFTIFPNQGKLLSLKLFYTSSCHSEERSDEESLSNCQKNNGQRSLAEFTLSEANVLGMTALTWTTKYATNYNQNKKIADDKYIQLVNKILSDRQTSIDQFGALSDLNLGINNYALKTGTSRDYHDSWVMGYTPDFLVGVWTGNSDNTPMNNVSGQTGAGKIWHQAMNLLINSEYNKKTNFNFPGLKEYTINNSLDYGLPNDNVTQYQNLLISQNIILNPHDQDVFLLENASIPLKASGEVSWYVNSELVGKGKEILFKPKKVGQYQIKAISGDKKEEIINILIK